MRELNEVAQPPIRPIVMRIFGRFLQILALFVILPLAVILEVSQVLGRDFGVSDMVVMLVVGTAAFLLGRIVEGYGR